MMDPQNMTRHYSNGEVTIIWKPALCIHSTVCWKSGTGLPAVFHPDTKPWITPGGSDTQTIIAQVKKCPSGALSFMMNS